MGDQDKINVFETISNRLRELNKEMAESLERMEQNKKEVLQGLSELSAEIDNTLERLNKKEIK